MHHYVAVIDNECEGWADDEITDAQLEILLGGLLATMAKKPVTLSQIKVTVDRDVVAGYEDDDGNWVELGPEGRRRIIFSAVTP